MPKPIKSTPINLKFCTHVINDTMDLIQLPKPKSNPGKHKVNSRLDFSISKTSNFSTFVILSLNLLRTSKSLSGHQLKPNLELRNSFWNIPGTKPTTPACYIIEIDHKIISKKGNEATTLKMNAESLHKLDLSNSCMVVLDIECVFDFYNFGQVLRRGPGWLFGLIFQFFDLR